MENREKEFLNSYYIYDNTVFGSHEETYQLDALLKEYSDQQNKQLLEEIERLKCELKADESGNKMNKEIVNDFFGLFSKQYDDEECGVHFKSTMRKLRDKYQS